MASYTSVCWWDDFLYVHITSAACYASGETGAWFSSGKGAPISPIWSEHMGAAATSARDSWGSLREESQHHRSVIRVVLCSSDERKSSQEQKIKPRVACLFLGYRHWSHCLLHCHLVPCKESINQLLINEKRYQSLLCHKGITDVLYHTKSILVNGIRAWFKHEH